MVSQFGIIWNHHRFCQSWKQETVEISPTKRCVFLRSTYFNSPDQDQRQRSGLSSEQSCRSTAYFLRTKFSYLHLSRYHIQTWMKLAPKTQRTFLTGWIIITNLKIPKHPSGPERQGTANKLSGRHGVIHVTGKTSRNWPKPNGNHGWLIWVNFRCNVLQLLFLLIWGKVSWKPYHTIYIYVWLYTMKSALKTMDPGMVQALERALWTYVHTCSRLMQMWKLLNEPIMSCDCISS